MELISYKTNIVSETDLFIVTPFLNNAVESINWNLDLNSKDKRLTIYTNSIKDEINVEVAICCAGFKALNLDDYYSIY